MPSTAPTTAPQFSILILLSFFLVFFASMFVFYALIRRWTSHRQWVSLAQWARETRYRLSSSRIDRLPDVLVGLFAANHSEPRLMLEGPRTRLIQLQTTVPGDEKNAPRIQRWNVLVRDLVKTWSPALARPANATDSLLDGLQLSEFPIFSSNRFVIRSVDIGSARKLAESGVHALLPADIGLLVHGQHLILDFSSRHFDAIELSRMIAIADQLQNL